MLVAVALVAGGCASSPSPPGSVPTRASAAESTHVSRPEDPRPHPPAVGAVTADDLGATWRRGCPVGPEGLRRVEVDYLGTDGDVHRGALVVNEDRVDDVIAIFGDLLAMRYPIEKMQTVDHYQDADDELSMRDNNTSAFNCRPLGDGWSQHAYGRAVDVNPLVNPYIDASGDLQPKTARRYLDRTRDVLGLLHAGDAAVRAFTDRGWRWGGAWHNPIDYQHFELP